MPSKHPFKECLDGIPIIISINQSKFLKIQTKSSLLGPIQQNGLQA